VSCGITVAEKKAPAAFFPGPKRDKHSTSACADAALASTRINSGVSFDSKIGEPW